MQVQQGKLFLVSAPSGAGKTSLLEQIVARIGQECDLHRVVTYTTRKPRSGERQGIDYHFLTDEQFLEKLNEDFFVEHSTAYGTYYGFPKEIVRSVFTGRNYIGIVDLAGAASIKTYFEGSILIGINPPNKKVLEDRLLERGCESDEEIALRLSLAQNELNSMTNGFFKHVITNNDFNEALDKLEAIVRNEISEVKS